MKPWTLEDIVEDLKDKSASGKSCAVLVGAGCSVTAGIPLAPASDLRDHCVLRRFR